MDKGKTIGTTGVAIGLGGAAALVGACCAAPWAVGVFGVAGAVAFARLSYLTPYLLVGAAMLLGAALWFAYRRPRDCEDGTCTAVARRRLRLVVWIGVLVVAASALWALSVTYLLS